MILKQTWIKLSDSSLAKWSKLFHLYGGFFRKHTQVTYYAKGTVRIVQPPLLLYKGFIVRRIIKGKVSRYILIRQVYKKKFLLFNSITFKLNSGLIVKKKNIPLSSYILGPVNKNLRKKKFLMLFPLLL